MGWIPEPGSGGVSDHGDLDGLADDDHTQYLNTTRHAAIDAADHGSGAATAGQVLTADGAGGAAWKDPTGGGAFAETIGDNSNTSFQVQHNLGTQDLVVQLWDLTGAEPIEATGDASQIEINDDNKITVTFSAAPATDSYRVVILASGGSSGGGGGAGGTALYGTASIDNPDTEVDVAHGIGSTPNRGEIQVSPANQDAAESDWWLSDFGPVTFRINVASPPITSAEFDWLYVKANEANPLGYAGEVLADEPLFYYRLEELSGLTVADATDNGNDGVVTGATLGVAGRVGLAASFDGINDYLTAVPVGDLSALTVECWAKIPNGVGGGANSTNIWGVIDVGSSNIIQLVVNSNGTLALRERTHSGTPSATTTANAWDDGEWHHIVALLQAGSLRQLWIDGAIEASGTAMSGSWTLTSTPLTFGGWSNRGTPETFVECTLDEIAFYNKLLTGPRIAAHFATAP